MNQNKKTISIRSGLNHDKQYGSIVSPISVSTTYNFLELNQPREHDYSRRKNPTRDLTQNALAQLEYGKNSILTSSGMSAIYLICIALLEPNDLMIAPYNCYGGTYRLLQALCKKKAFHVQFIHQENPQEIQESLKYNPKLIFMETPSNPMFQIVDIYATCQLKSDILYVVDNTFMTPIFQNPLLLGANIVIHSCSKYLNGHSDVIAGVVTSNNACIIDKLQWWANAIGITSSAFDSYQLLRGIRTLVPRINQQQKNTKKIISFCQKQSKIQSIYYSGLPTNPGYEIACRQQSGFGSVFSFELKGDNNTLKKFLKSLKLFTLAESFGGIESLIAHPSTMTHAAMPEEIRKKIGISDMILRISVGLEDSNDLIADLDTAFSVI